MPKMCFPTIVKYNNGVYSAREVFEVKKDDVESLKAKGGWVVEEPVKQESEDTEPQKKKK